MTCCQTCSVCAMPGLRTKENPRYLNRLMSLSSPLNFICFPSCLSILSLFAADLHFRTCGRTWRKVGCFKDLKGGQRALKEQMVNIRDRKSKVFPAGEPKLSWKHLTESFHRYVLKEPMGLIQFVSGPISLNLNNT